MAPLGNRLPLRRMKALGRDFDSDAVGSGPFSFSWPGVVDTFVGCVDEVAEDAIPADFLGYTIEPVH